MYCSKCGKELKADENFCSQCGTPVKRDSTEQAKDMVKDVTSKLKGFWNKAKETCVEVYKNAVPPTPTLEIEFNTEVEKILLDMGFQWFYSDKNREKLRLYKYYINSIGNQRCRVEIETFTDSYSDIYVCHNIYGSYEEILMHIMYDFIKLRKYIYVRVAGTEERIKLVEFCNLHDITNNETSEIIEIEPSVAIKLTDKVCKELEKMGYSKKCKYKNDGTCDVEFEKQCIIIRTYFNTDEEISFNKGVLCYISIAEYNVINVNYYSNEVISNIIELLKLKENIIVTDSYNNEFKMSLIDFLSNTNLKFITNEDYKISKDEVYPIEDITTNTKRIKR